MDSYCPATFNDAYNSFNKYNKPFESPNNYNIFDQLRGTKYNIDEDNYMTFFELLNVCNKNKVCMHIAETQRSLISCIDIDLDIKQKDDINLFTNVDYEYIVNRIIAILDEYCDIEQSFYIAVLSRCNITSSSSYFKNGIHIRVFIKFSYIEKEYIIRKIIDEDIFKVYYINNPNIINTDFIDQHAIKNSVLLYGSNKRTNHIYSSYKLDSIYQCNNTGIVLSVDLSTINLNLPLELSILFPGSILIKDKYRAIFKVTLQTIEYTVNDAPDCNTTVEDNISNDEEYIKFLLFKIFDKRRYIEYMHWSKIIIWLGQLSLLINITKQLAYDFSKQWSGYDNRAEHKIDELWEYGRQHKVNHVLKCFEKYAREDDPQLFKTIYNKRYKTKIYDMLADVNGKINDYDIAHIIEQDMGNTLIYQDCWWHFTGKYWEQSKYPPKKVHHIVNVILYGQLKSTIDYVRNENHEDKKSINSFISNLTNSLNKCKTFKFYDSVVKQLTTLCRREPAIIFDNPQTNQYIVGFANGLFDLKSFKFIDDSPEYYITRHTNAALLNIPSLNDIFPNPNNKNYSLTMKVLNILKDIIDNEESFQFILCYLASSLNNIKKSPIFFIWYGNGKNGKSTIDELMQQTYGSVVANGLSYKMPAVFYTSDKETTGPDTTKIQLKYARYVACGEINIGKKLNIAKIKETTSNTLSCNEKYKTQELFMPTCIFTMAINDKPKFYSRDYGTQRRIYMYTFETTFIDEPKRKNEKKCNNKIYEDVLYNKDCSDSFLEILLYYYMVYSVKYNEILESIPHKKIEDQSKSFYLDQDYLSKYISEELTFERGQFISLSALFPRYKAWMITYVDSQWKSSISNVEIELFQSSVKDSVERRDRRLIIRDYRFLHESEKDLNNQEINNAIMLSISDDNIDNGVDTAIMTDSNVDNIIDATISSNIANDIYSLLDNINISNLTFDNIVF